MSDPLTKLLRQADGQSPAPALDPIALPGRVRRIVRRQRQRRMIGATAASVTLFLSGSLVILIHHLNRNHLPPSPIAQVNTESLENMRLQATYHERVAALLMANEQTSAPRPAVTDAFLRQLQFERSKAAIVLLNGANDRLQDGQHNADAVVGFKQMIALFPDTPAATIAQQRVKQLENSKRQS